MKKFASLIALVALFSMPAMSGTQLTPEEKRTLELKPAVVLVVVSVKVEADFHGQPVSLRNPYLTTAGSGFLFRHDGYLITNGHVVQNAKINDPQAKEALEEKLRAKVYAEVFQAFDQYLASKGHPPLTTAQKIEIYQSRAVQIHYHNPTLTVYLANGNHVPGELTPSYSPEIGVGKDVAIVKIDGTNLPSVPLGDSNKVREQDRIMVIGYPGVASDWGGNELISSSSALVPSVTSGSISAIKTLAATSAPVLQSDAAITHGNSGGPAFNAQGEVIGIATAGSEATQGFNFFVPINTAWEFVRREGVAPDVGPFTQHWRKAIDLFDEKKCRSSIPEFDDVLQFMPGLPDAARLRASAVECVDNETIVDKISDSPAGPWLLYGLVGIAILAIAAMVMRSRSAPAVKAAPAQPSAAMPGATRLEAPIAPPALPSGQSFGNIQATAGALSGKTFKIPKEGLLIGRSPKCQVVLQDDTVSSEHAWIVPSGSEVVVIDKGSSNGTYVNSVDSPKVSKIGLRNGDRIFLGRKGSNVFTYFNS
ncbi:MAG TPA: trypsin-like peptidase domain-containing protein [Terriglobales bacterium]|nr:trypsin-like peptidase domain-containing protein [Terriglobales bacterium]